MLEHLRCGAAAGLKAFHKEACDRFNACNTLHVVLERMKAEGLEAVLGEYDYEPSEFTSDGWMDEEVPRLPALPW